MKILFWLLIGIGALIEPALHLTDQEDVRAPELIIRLADMPVTRNHLYLALVKKEKAHLFPLQHRQIEKVAESAMACWLLHEHELGAAPDEIELIARQEVMEEERRVELFLFRFKVKPPHWAAGKGWMCGVSGPFWEDLLHECHGSSTFSEFQNCDERTPEEHFMELSKAVQSLGLAVPS